MKTSLKIAILGTRYSPPNFRGGEEHVIHYLNRYFQKRGCLVDVYTPEFVKWREIDAVSTADNVTRIPVNNIRFFYHYQFARKFPHFLKRNDYDVILNTHNPLGINMSVRPQIPIIATTCLGEAAAVQGNSPLKLLERLMRRSFSYQAEKKVIRESDHIICVNDHIQEEVIQFFGAAESKTTVIGNGVDSEYFRPSESAEINPSNQFNVLYVGRLANRKNVQLLVKAAELLKQHHTRFRVRIVGDGPERQDLERLAKDTGVSDIVEFYGRKADMELLELFQSSQVYVLPSRYEGMPLALLEALSCGLPSVVSDFAGAKHIIKNKFNGYILTGNDPKQLAGRLTEIAESSDLLRSMSDNARSVVLHKFSWEKVIDQYYDVIKKVLK